MKLSKYIILGFTMLLCLVLYETVGARKVVTEEIIFGGAEGAFVTSVGYEFKDPNYVEVILTESDLWDWPVISQEELDNNQQYKMVSDKSLLSSASAPDECVKISGTNMMFSKQAIDQLEAMLQDMRDAGFSIYVAGAYRSYSFQTQLFNGKASQIALGYGVTDYLDPKYQEAVAEARTITMFPGASEHQLGLAVDLMDRHYGYMVYENMNQEFFEYLDSICASYGFIKRYPTKKLLLTGWDEPWHYRYVGVEAAEFIMEHNICFEEFYQHYHPDYTY